MLKLGGGLFRTALTVASKPSEGNIAVERTWQSRSVTKKTQLDLEKEVPTFGALVNKIALIVICGVLEVQVPQQVPPQLTLWLVTVCSDTG